MLAGTVTAALRDLYSAMDKGTGSSIPPFMLLQVMHIAFPRFAEKSSHGGYQQQVSMHSFGLFFHYTETFSLIPGCQRMLDRNFTYATAETAT